MKLYGVHCGFYDTELCEGVYEAHVNFFVTAENFEEARAKAKLHPDYKKKRMHVDGVQEIVRVDGFDIELKQSGESQPTLVISQRHRDLAPKPQT